MEADPLSYIPGLKYPDTVDNANITVVYKIQVFFSDYFHHQIQMHKAPSVLRIGKIITFNFRLVMTFRVRRRYVDCHALDTRYM